MAYTITDIAELVRYHLVLAEPDDTRADDNLAQLVSELQSMPPVPFAGRHRGSSAIGAGAPSIPTSSTPTDTTTLTMATSTAPTAGNYSGLRPDRRTIQPAHQHAGKRQLFQPFLFVERSELFVSVRIPNPLRCALEHEVQSLLNIPSGFRG